MHISNISSFKSFSSCGFKTIQKDNQNIKVFLQYKDLEDQNFINDLMVKVFTKDKFSMILAIVQARMDSSRFPGKVLKKSIISRLLKFY